MRRGLFGEAWLLLIPLCLVQSQEKEAPSAFISAYAGGFYSSREDFGRTYGTRLGLVPGGAFGLPLSSEAFLYARGTYFSKRGIPLLNSYVAATGQFVGTPAPGGTATFREWIFNLGVLQNFAVTKQINSGVSAGLTYSSITEELRYAAGTPTATRSEKGLLGLFVGADIELRISNSPFSAVAETQYNFAWPVLSIGSGDNGGLSVTAGIRYYFKDSRRR